MCQKKQQNKREKKTLWGLIWYFLCYLVQVFKKKHEQQEAQEQQDNANFNQHVQDVQNQYNKIDEDLKENESQINNSELNDVANNLNNRF